MPDSRHWVVLKHGGDSLQDKPTVVARRIHWTGVSDVRVTDHVVMITPCCHAESLTLKVTVDDSLDLFLLLQRKERDAVENY